MKLFKKISVLFILGALFAPCFVHSATTSNPRKNGTANASRAATVISPRATTSARSATNRNVARSATNRNVVRSATTQATTSARSAVRPNTTQSVRSAVRAGATNVRSAIPTNAVRSATNARATAVFNDMSKMGGVYGACRDAYNTCMDQFCANADESIGRCYCSDRYEELVDKLNNTKAAEELIVQFNDNNLNAIGLSGDEVDAMYSASEGESAIKNDTSASAELLAGITDLLSGKTSANTNRQNLTTSLGVLDFSVDDIWGDSGGDIFGGGTSGDLSAKSGKNLYNDINKQCRDMAESICESTANFNMAQSAYSMLIAQRCNEMERAVVARTETVLKVVADAERQMRAARLEDFRAHNSADVNQCIDAVREALMDDRACGSEYSKCLDSTGKYIDTNGEPIYTTELSDLTNSIELTDFNTVLQSNRGFDTYLDSKKMFAETALDSCRNIADTVWTEFKRTAIVEIAQAQDAKLEEIKDNCVVIARDCLNDRTEDMAGFDEATAKRTGALSVGAAEKMCQEKVDACELLFGGEVGFEAFVEITVDIQQELGCKTAVDEYITEHCPKDSCDETTLAELRAFATDTYCEREQIAVSGGDCEALDDLAGGNGNVVSGVDGKCEISAAFWNNLCIKYEGTPTVDGCRITVE